MPSGGEHLRRSIHESESQVSELHFVGGEKGGVGKSVMARLIAQHWIDQNKPWHGFDTDRSHGALLRYYKEYATPVEISRVEDLDKIIELASQPDKRVLVDLAAQTERDLHAWVESGDLLELAGEANLKVVFWHVMDDGKDSVDLLGRLLARYGQRANYVVVFNRGRGENFAMYQGSPVAAEVARLGVPTIQLPALHKGTMLKIDQLDKSFWAAVNHRETETEKGLGMMERQRVKVWLRNAYAQLDQLGV